MLKEDTIDHNKEVLVEDGDIRNLSSDLRLLTHNEHSDGTVVPSCSTLPIRVDHVQQNEGSSDYPIHVTEKQVRSSFPGKLSFEVRVPMLQPITTSYASLTSDKLPSSQTRVPASKSSHYSAAALKSVQILSKFWGDEVEEGEDYNVEALLSSKKIADPKVIQHWAKTPVLTPMAMSVTMLKKTLSHDKSLEVEEDSVEAIVSNFEQHYPNLSESTKAEKKKTHVNKVKPASFNSAGMRTRAQKGSSKVVLADTE